MSRIGNAPVILPKEVTATIDDKSVVVKGPKGELPIRLPLGVTASLTGEHLVLAAGTTSRRVAALHGLARAIIANAVKGVTTGWSKSLELVGVGYRASMAGANVQISVGFSHPVVITPPPGISLSVTEGKIVVTGADRQIVGETAARIRRIKKPEPYKGKGIRYLGERVRKKAGKAAKAIGGAPGVK